MKTLMVIAFVLAGIAAQAQKVNIIGASVEITSDAPIEESFDLIKKLLPRKWFYFDRYVTCKGVTYYKPFYSNKIRIVKLRRLL